MDIPRLSTLQAMLIILKAREAAPKRGYYFRSWMSIVHCVQMGKDLGLDDHFADHTVGNECDCSPIECAMKTRLWQVIFTLEVMIGSPQGKEELGSHIGALTWWQPPTRTFHNATDTDSKST
jgi:hypothetical protein